MTDAFDTLIPDARTFLGELDTNNTRDWFNTQKARYDRDLKAPALLLLDQIAGDLGKMTGDPVTTKLFRPQRDVRFSKDKTPYHTHLHMLWTSAVGRQQPLAWFFGISPDYISIGAGVMGFEKDALMNWRAAVDGPEGAGIAAIIDAVQALGARLDEPALKRVPAPYDKDHPRGDLLRRKGLAMWFDLSPAEVEKGGLTKTIMTAFSRLKPVQDALRPLL
ncbi:TIGR02453 family protein [Shimia biformata]|uniref:TIGR02453 family protein n=1 Tax=Shimia biformata TaxID=1294299 RepID=UPI00195034DD|nr:TIGR02453 family protein [Shimia biformata]